MSKKRQLPAYEKLFKRIITNCQLSLSRDNSHEPKNKGSSFSLNRSVSRRLPQKRLQIFIKKI
jgi:hypothetical protein